MNVRLAAALAAIGLALAAWPAASPRYMSIDEVRPGMTGVGRTVFGGDKIEEFTVHILGVLRNIDGPRRDLVLARLEGGRLAEVGVIAGMSGSPVYVDGRLLGAVAYSLGQFPKEPIAGITPIEEMIQTAGPAPGRAVAASRPTLELPLTEARAMASLRDAFARFERPFADRADGLRFDGLGSIGSSSGAEIGTLMRPIATPLTLSGFSGPVGERLAGALGEAGFVSTSDGASRARPQAGERQAAATGPALRPGDAVGVNLIGGDLVMGATGTVTEVDGTRVYAFGHPLYNLGTTEFPMTRAYVHALLPSLLSSLKITTTGETIGTITQDRSTAIAGTLGAGPALVPIRLAIETGRGIRKAFDIQVVNDPLFTPLLTYVAVLNSLSAYEREYAPASYSVSGRVAVQGHGAVGLDEVFAGDSASVGVAASVAAPLTLLLGNDIGPARIEGIDLRVTTSERPQTATLERVFVDAARVRPGTTVPLVLLWRTYRGDTVTRTVPIDVPAESAGSLTVTVTDGARLAQSEVRDLRSGQVKSLDQLIRLLNASRRSNRLYIRLLHPEGGAVVGGESFPALPPSVLSVMEADRNGGSFAPLRGGAAGEWEVAVGCAISGSRTLTIALQ
jgi:hypothetical protein